MTTVDIQELARSFHMDPERIVAIGKANGINTAGDIDGKAAKRLRELTRDERALHVPRFAVDYLMGLSRVDGPPCPTCGCNATTLVHRFAKSGSADPLDDSPVMQSGRYQCGNCARLFCAPIKVNDAK